MRESSNLKLPRSKKKKMKGNKGRNKKNVQEKQILITVVFVKLSSDQAGPCQTDLAKTSFSLS